MHWSCNGLNPNTIPNLIVILILSTHGHEDQGTRIHQNTGNSSCSDNIISQKTRNFSQHSSSLILIFQYQGTCKSTTLLNQLDREHHDVLMISYKRKAIGTSSTTTFYYIWLNQVCYMFRPCIWVIFRL